MIDRPTQDTITISRMLREDLDEVLWVEESSFRMPWSRKLFEDEFKNPEMSHLYVARCLNHIVGYMGFWLIQNEAHITNLAVHPAFRRKRIGEQLLQYTLQQAMQKGVAQATLEVRAGNLAAIKLYEKHHFKLVAIRRKYYNDNNEDALIMWNTDLRLGA